MPPLIDIFLKGADFTDLHLQTIPKTNSLHVDIWCSPMKGVVNIIEIQIFHLDE